MSRIVEQVKSLFRAGLSDANVAEAREQIKREDFAKSEEARRPLFNKAVAAIRRGESTTQVAADLDSQCERLGIDSFEIACSARTHVEQNQKAAWEMAVEAFQGGAAVFQVEKRLREDFGFLAFDAEQVAYRAKRAAEQAA